RQRWRPPSDAAADMDRHLDWGPGCRKEAVELQEGVATVSLALVPAEPDPALEDRIVATLAGSAHAPRPGQRDTRASRRPIQALAAATLAAVLVATVAVGWAVAERFRAQGATSSRQQSISRLRDLIASL